MYQETFQLIQTEQKFALLFLFFLTYVYCEQKKKKKKSNCDLNLVFQLTYALHNLVRRQMNLGICHKTVKLRILATFQFRIGARVRWSIKYLCFYSNF